MRIAESETAIQEYVTKFGMARFLNEDLLRHLKRFHFPPYSSVYIEQDEQHYLYFLVEGMVQCSHYQLSGRLSVFAISTPFAAIGDMEILSETRVHSNVIATRNTIMLGIERPVVHRYGRDDPRFLRFLLEQVREKLYRTNHLQVTQVLPVTERLAVYLLAQLEKGESDAITLPDKDDLASLLGITTRHLNRVLKELVEGEMIAAGYPRLHIPHPERLRALIEG